ncbi:hypothetical protein [Halalkalibacter krulwichiae]|uniref:DUF8052 domain-containing protein n=1 Tax=Halalkalibacter krulwichiae TaxID=199441 RepID=A0A1X9M7Q4_9BACI|nr:hypothetical protein [Halalkalibacter krulwichiae]ARK29475.1 hypothetical protein BkAM31D_06180 [Halalkalibacter krulwichiae]
MAETRIETFINHMANRYTTSFNVYRDESIGAIPLNFYAEFQRRDEKYLMTKAIKVWGVETQQYTFVTHQTVVTKETLMHLAKEIDRHIPSFVPKKQEHMSTYFVGVIVTDQSIEKKVEKLVRGMRKIKFLKYGWHGWADRYIAVVSLKDREVYIHKKGEDFISTFKNALTEGG